MGKGYKTYPVYGQAYVKALTNATGKTPWALSQELGYSGGYLSWVVKDNKISNKAALTIKALYGIEWEPFLIKEEGTAPVVEQPSLLDGEKDLSATITAAVEKAFIVYSEQFFTRLEKAIINGLKG